MTMIDENRIAEMSTAAIAKALERCRVDLVEAVREAALYVAELRRRGVQPDIPDTGVWRYLPQIAAGEIAPEAALEFSGRPMLLTKIRGLPIDDQVAFAAGRPIEVAERTTGGEVEVLRRSLIALSGRQMNRALGFGRVRSVAEQRETLKREAARPGSTRTRTLGARKQVRARPSDGMLIVGGVEVRPQDLSAALGALGFALVRVDAAARAGAAGRTGKAGVAGAARGARKPS